MRKSNPAGAVDAAIEGQRRRSPEQSREAAAVSFKVILSGGVVVVLVTALSSCLFFGVFTPTAPSGWGQVHAGMNRSQVLALVGPPQQSGWPENVAETWQVNGLFSHRRLFVIYEGERVRD